MDRRAFSLSLLGLLASTALVRAEEAVFLDYTRDTLDKAYDQRVWAPDAQQIIARYARDSEEVRKRFPP
ncbi:MAG: esterase, partial [Rhizobiales bacterium 35-68-8]